MKDLFGIYDEIIVRLEAFYKAFEKQWMWENKPHGFDVMDIRLGGLHQRMQHRLDSFYDEIDDVEETVDTLQERIVNIRSNKISSENIYQFLQFYGIMYDNFTDAEKKEFMKTFVEKVEIYKEPLPNGQLLKKITFAFPVFYKVRNCAKSVGTKNLLARVWFC